MNIITFQKEYIYIMKNKFNEGYYYNSDGEECDPEDIGYQRVSYADNREVIGKSDDGKYILKYTPYEDIYWICNNNENETIIDYAKKDEPYAKTLIDKYRIHFMEDKKYKKSINMKKYFRESEKKHTIELVYNSNYHLYCPDFANDRVYDVDDPDFWNKVDRNIKELVDEDNDLTEYLPKDLKDKVTSVKLSYEDDNRLYVICEVSGDVDSVKDQLIDYVNGQMSDGWGEGFEQQDLASTTVYACYDQNDTSSHPYIEFYSNVRDARDYCESQNEDYDYDDEEDEENRTDYTYEEVEVYVTCSFWERGAKIPSEVLIDGYNEEGFDKAGYDKNGYNRYGYDKDGFDKKGMDRAGYDRDGYDSEGYNEVGRDRDGFDKSGVKASGVKGINVNKSGKAFVADPYSGLKEKKNMRKNNFRENEVPFVELNKFTKEMIEDAAKDDYAMNHKNSAADLVEWVFGSEEIKPELARRAYKYYCDVYSELESHSEDDDYFDDEWEETDDPLYGYGEDDSLTESKIREALYMKGDFEDGTLAGNKDYENNTDWSNDNYTDKDIDQEIEKYPYSAAKLDPKKFVKILRSYLPQNTYAVLDEKGSKFDSGNLATFYLYDDDKKVLAVLDTAIIPGSVQLRIPEYSVVIEIDHDEDWDEFANDFVVQVWRK